MPNLSPHSQILTSALSEASNIPAVLIVDHEDSSITLGAQLLDNLNYPHFAASSAREALELIVQHPSIQIVIAHAQMPQVDGFSLIEEARSRIDSARHLAAIVTTEQLSTELAIKSLHVEAVDMICKPLDFDSYAGALRRANRYLSARRSIAEDASTTNFGHQLQQLRAMLETVSTPSANDAAPTDAQIGAALRTIIHIRSLRGRYFAGQIFADPAWDILLDLARAKLDGQQVSVSSVCIAASVPMSTALRWVKQMTDASLLLRWTDPKDRRRDLIDLTDSTSQQMRDYLVTVHNNLRALT